MTGKHHFKEIKLPSDIQSCLSGFSSMHTHTVFDDGKDDVETMCRTAYDKKMSAIGFSAHVPLEKQINMECEWILKEENVDGYTTEVHAAKKRWHGKLPVFFGFEADYIKGRRSPLDSDIIALKPDYLIGSVHFLFPDNDVKPFTVDGSEEEFDNGLRDGFGGDVKKLMNKYYDAVLEMIYAGGFDILGHADILKKSTQDKYPWLQEIENKRQREVGEAAAKTGIVIEVNTGGLNRKKVRDVYPSLSFLKIFRELNVPVIITSDAHCAKDIDGNYDIALKTLIHAGFREHMLFN